MESPILAPSTFIAVGDLPPYGGIISTDGGLTFGPLDVSMISKGFANTVVFDASSKRWVVGGEDSQKTRQISYAGVDEVTQPFRTATWTTDPPNTEVVNMCVVASKAVVNTPVNIPSGTSYFQSLSMGPGAQMSIPSGTGAQIIVQAEAVLAGTLTVTGIETTGTIPVLTAEEVSGQFETVNAVNSCGGEAEASTVQTATTLSVVVTAVGPCPGGNSLSTGAIVGIAVGATVAGVLLILLVAFMVKRSTQNRTKKLNQRIHNETLDL